MIFCKTPYRISLFGGSTDYEYFYSRYGSLLIGFTINQYVYTAMRYNPEILPYAYKIAYSKVEICDSIDKIEHNGVRGVLNFYKNIFGYNINRLELNHLSDLPSQTGLGSSSSFIVNIIKSLDMLLGVYPKDKKNLADLAIHIERKLLNEPGGIQDQIFAAYGGGFKSIHIAKNGVFKVAPLPIDDSFTESIIDRSVLIYIGTERKSFEIASSHSLELSHKLDILKIASEAYKAFVYEDIDEIAKLLHSSWLAKKSISNSISNFDVDTLYDTLISNGAIGGKLLGAGGSGFIYAILDKKVNKTEFLKNINNLGFKHINFSINTE